MCSKLSSLIADEPHTDTEQYIRSVLNILSTSKANDDLETSFEHVNATNPALNILFYFVTTSALLKDPELDQMLREMLHDQCCAQPIQHNIERNCGLATVMDKRTAPRKARFHSWGGKRNHETPKIVIRTPFRPWGGKRSGNKLQENRWR